MEKKVLPEYSEYYGFLLKYRDELRNVLSNEREKRQSLLDSNMERLEAVLALQQAETMKLRQMEDKRIKLQGALSDGEATASDFVTTIGDESTKAAFSSIIKEMSELAGEIKEQNSLALEIAKTNLKLIEKVFPANHFDRDKVVYSPDSAKRSEGPATHSVELKF